LPPRTCSTDRTLRAFTLSEEEEELAEHAALTNPQNGSSSRQQVRLAATLVQPAFLCPNMLDSP